jgi:hypothetical protein
MRGKLRILSPIVLLLVVSPVLAQEFTDYGCVGTGDYLGAILAVVTPVQKPRRNIPGSGQH